MKPRLKKYSDVSPVETLVLRDSLGFGRYRKKAGRDRDKSDVLLDLGLKKIEAKEKDDFLPLGYRRRKVKI